LQGVDSSVSAVALLTLTENLGQTLLTSGARSVALYADNSIGWAIVDLACQLHSICLTPIPTFFSASQIEHLLTRSGVDTLVFDSRLAKNLRAEKLAGAADMADLPGFSVVSRIPGHTPAMPSGTTKITFTSGSTGTPKGVCLSFMQCLKVAESLAHATDVPHPRHLCVLPLSTLLENIGGIYMPLLAGGSSVIVSPEELGMSGSSGLDSGKFLAAFEQFLPDTLILVPQLLAVLDTAMAGGWQPPENLRFVAVGGARVAPDMVRRVRARGLPVYEGYGLSECASVVSLNSPRHDRLGTSGRVLPHVEVREREGEVEVLGNVFLGYLDQPSTWGVASVATGDVGRLDPDGYLTIEGRSKNILITSFGRNVSPEWIESELSATGLFHQVLVLGDGRPSCAALLRCIDPDTSAAEIQAVVDSANCDLPDYARIGHWLRLDEPLSLATGLLTENGRPRRDKIQDHYLSELDKLYDDHKESIAS
jgi:long-chain acyl-CoA synthetase